MHHVEDRHVILPKAIQLAQTDHVIYFLLAAYVETLDYYDPARSALPPQVRRLPIAGRRDIAERLHALRGMPRTHVAENPQLRAVVEEAVETFSAALQRLRSLTGSAWRTVQHQAAQRRVEQSCDTCTG
jgi:hypothetical protein